jgi:hypothetical protein
MPELPEGWIKPTPQRRDHLRQMADALSRKATELERLSKAECIDYFALANFFDEAADQYIELAQALREDFEDMRRSAR